LYIDYERRTNLTRKTTKPAKKPAAKKLSAKKSARKKAAPARKAAPAKKSAPKKPRTPETTLLSRILTSLDDDKAEQIATIDLEGRSSLCDTIVIANGRSSRHVASIADRLARRLKEAGYGTCHVDGLTQGDWVLIDAGDVIVHVFRPEVRAYYDLEGMWRVDERPSRARRAVH
jgi:ribosome-associated protein